MSPRDGFLPASMQNRNHDIDMMLGSSNGDEPLRVSHTSIDFVSSRMCKTIMDVRELIVKISLVRLIKSNLQSER